MAVPIVLYAGRFEPGTAITLSLLMVGVASAVAVTWHAKAGHLNLRAALSFGIASFVGAAIGGRVAHFLPSRWLLAGFTAIMLVTGIAMWRSRRGSAKPAAARSVKPLRVVIYGMGVGVLTGTVGAGGGFVIVPVLTLLLGLEMPVAIGTSLAIIAGNSLFAFVSRLGSAPLDGHAAAVLTLSTVMGAVAGVTLAKRVPVVGLRRGFALLVLTVATGMALQQVFPLGLAQG